MRRLTGLGTYSMSFTGVVGPLPRGYELLWERMHEMSPGDPGGSRFTALLTRGLGGQVDADALEKALADVTRRHEMLRMRFKTTGLDPLVEIVEDVEAELHVEDLRHHPPSERQALVAHVLYLESVRAFDLVAVPVWRACLLRLSEDYSILCVSFPDFLFDAWSDRILVQDLMACYSARLGLSRPPTPVSYGYRDLLNLHERQYGGRGPRIQEQVSRLHPLPRPLSIDPRDTAASDLLIDPAAIDFSVSSEVSARLDDCATRLRTTQYVVLMAAYYLVVASVSGSSKVVVSTVTLGRHSKAERALVGQFGQDVFVPVNIDWKGSLEAFVQQVHRALADARLARTGYRNLVELLGEAHRPRPWSDLHLFDSYFQSVVPESSESFPGPLRVDHELEVIPAPLPGVDEYPRLGDVPSEAMPVWWRQAQPWMLVDSRRQGGTLNFNRTFYDESQVKGRITSFLEVLRAIADDSGQPVWKAVG
ncbi:condensation domain-containing protein (plasmid) [Streptomyces sp. BB1-1-1]|uniref:condensation domain-containing protein n=1 Tax=Streptomyces sp. BB1-1-1 TaxID=3074430 RepID=UPI002877EF28|nr:condensation domain-containing protein [Streptomyces sp. BB1-1-1]WND32868.1 condensation domain-containing protein [Streptomyces sp. BB1-1-1]WND40063.1 condensation domain-containing protein [Streptomyces sp. BB1-1-1]WND40898.1 condensation domain-containing protein [Streptomyces sp. BB1-1-1]